MLPWCAAKRCDGAYAISRRGYDGECAISQKGHDGAYAIAAQGALVGSRQAMQDGIVAESNHLLRQHWPITMVLEQRLAQLARGDYLSILYKMCIETMN